MFAVPFRHGSPREAALSGRRGRTAADRGAPIFEISMNGIDFVVETSTWIELSGRLADWSRLVETALEPNAFLEPGFLIPAAQHLDGLAEARFLVVSGGDDRRMVALWPLSAPSLGGLARTWTHVYAACGVPLLDETLAEQACEAALRALAARAANVAGVVAPMTPVEGRTAEVFRACAKRLGLSWRASDPRDRPILTTAKSGAAAEQSGREKKTRRALRKLEELDRVEHRVWREPHEIREALELFLALESRGWKGRNGTALLQDPRSATFVRTMSRLLARDGKIQIDGLCLADAPIALTISLYSGDRAFLWKTAYDETAAAGSPGAQLIVRMSGQLLAAPGIACADSCASGDNPAIARLWAERMSICDFYLSCAPDRNTLFDAAVAREDLRRKIRAGAKTAYRAARAARQS
jgi:CelD/BcsL family acetyltransferase involved in cellulose biosynthesis